jgi:flagellar protein FlaF
MVEAGEKEPPLSLAAYQRIAHIAETPRRTEQRLFADITGALGTAWESGRRGSALMPELHRNRELWSALSADCGTPGNGLPEGLRASIISLALWVDRFTSEVVAGRETIEPLVDVNRAVMEGLGAP